MSQRRKIIASFVFLEIRDPEIYVLLNGLRREFGQEVGPLHITVRGPYVEPIRTDDLRTWQHTIDQSPLIIQSAGLFNNGKEAVAYLKVDSLDLRKIWWKPDYPIEKYGFNPHITIYKGTDKVFSRKVFEFLKNEDLCLACNDVVVTTFVSKQQDMFAMEFKPGTNQFLELANRRKVKADILQRAANLFRAERLQRKFACQA